MIFYSKSGADKPKTQRTRLALSNDFMHGLSPEEFTKRPKP